MPVREGTDADAGNSDCSTYEKDGSMFLSSMHMIPFLKIYKSEFRLDVFCCYVGNRVWKEAPCHIGFRWYATKDVFIASRDELLESENQIRQKKKLGPLTALSDDWTYLLTETQKRYLTTYWKTWIQTKHTSPENDETCIFDLSQNAEKRPSTSARGVMPCLRHSGNILWVPKLRRWLVTSELAVASGFPVRRSLAEMAGLDQADSTTLQTRSEDLGNAMVTWSVATVLACALSCAAVKA